MSENNEFDRKAAEADVEAAEGQYVEGDYGAAGTAGENPAEAVEGEYPTGDYGAAGTAGATAVGAEEGDYPEGDYGAAGGTGAARRLEGENRRTEYHRRRHGTAGGRRNRTASGGLRAQRTGRRPAVAALTCPEIRGRMPLRERSVPPEIQS